MGEISNRFIAGGFENGLYMSIIAFSIVFLVTAGLMFVMMALKYFSTVSNREKTDGGKGEPVPPDAPAQSRAVSLSAPEDSAKSDDGELMAVIAAAITAMSGGAAKILACSPVKAARTEHGIPAWRMSGIIDNSLGPRS
jgi:Na+-transporting methylmalonyl-CoA/oxaloacetate decarboxylase gamma subunit